MTRLRSSTFAPCAAADGSSFGEAGSAGPRVRRGIGRAVTTAAAVAAVMIGTESSALACPVCFGAEETSVIHGTRLGIVVMLAVTFSVQGAFAGFFLYLRKRAKRHADVDLDMEWSELQRGSRTS
jgi:hypothetical protein